MKIELNISFPHKGAFSGKVTQKEYNFVLDTNQLHKELFHRSHDRRLKSFHGMVWVPGLQGIKTSDHQNEFALVSEIRTIVKGLRKAGYMTSLGSKLEVGFYRNIESKNPETGEWEWTSGGPIYTGHENPTNIMLMQGEQRPEYTK